jgi:drug/metabolite transporter (DMT)-like permease
MLGAIAMATVGVLLVSWPRPSHGGRSPSLQSALLGLGSGALFGCAAIGYRGGILALGAPSFVAGATTALAIALLMQTVLLTAYLATWDRPVLAAIVKAWRPSLFAGFMGAFASQLWFLAFALQSAALVRTVALIEILFALGVSRGLLRQRVGRREMAGILLLVAGVAVLLNAE